MLFIITRIQKNFTFSQSWYQNENAKNFSFSTSWYIKMREPNFSFSTSLIKMRMPTTTGRTWESFKTCAATRPESTLCWPTRISYRSAYSYYPHTHHQHHHHQHHYHQPVYPAGVHTLLKLYTLTILILTNNIRKNKSWFHGFLTTNIPITTHSSQ